MKKYLLILVTAIFSTVFLSTSYAGKNDGLADGCEESGKIVSCQYTAIDFCEWKNTGSGYEFKGCYQVDC